MEDLGVPTGDVVCPDVRGEGCVRCLGLVDRCSDASCRAFLSVPDCRPCASYNTQKAYIWVRADLPEARASRHRRDSAPHPVRACRMIFETAPVPGCCLDLP